MRNFNHSYDAENDELFLFRPDTKSKGSVEIGDFVLDFDSKNGLVGFQVMNASKSIKDMVDSDIVSVRKLLSNLTECRLEAKSKGNALIIKFVLVSGNDELMPVFCLPSIKESSPALAKV